MSLRRHSSRNSFLSPLSTPQKLFFCDISAQRQYDEVEAYLQFLCEHPELHDTIRALGKKYKVEDVNAAFDDAKTGNNIKTMLVKE